MKIINVPNLLTLFRVALIPVLVIIFYVPDSTLSLTEKNILGTFIFSVAAITDWLDGYLARKLKQTSKFGAFLDPVADKLIVITALLLLLDLGRINLVIALIIIGREFTVSSLREWMAQLGKSQSIAVAFIGKLKNLMDKSYTTYQNYPNPGRESLLTINYLTSHVKVLLCFNNS